MAFSTYKNLVRRSSGTPTPGGAGEAIDQSLVNLADTLDTAEQTANKDQPNGYVGLNEDGELVANLIVRTGTAAEMSGIVLSEGELGYSTDDKRLLIGDGETSGGIAALRGTTTTISEPSSSFTIPSIYDNVIISYTVTNSTSTRNSHTVTPIDNGTYTGQRLTLIFVLTANSSGGTNARSGIKIYGGDGLSISNARTFSTPVINDEVDYATLTCYFAQVYIWSGSQWCPAGDDRGYANEDGVNDSKAFGVASIATGRGSLAGGYTTSSTGNYGVSWGSSITNAGANSTGFGANLSISSSCSFTSGKTLTNSGDSSALFGYGARSRLPGSVVFGSGNQNGVGSNQGCVVSMSGQTTSTTPVILSTQTSAGTTTAGLPVTARSTWTFTALVSAYHHSIESGCGFRLTGVINRNATSGTSIIGTVLKDSFGNTGSFAGCDVSATADDTNDRLIITVTGLASVTMTWTATLTISEAGATAA